MSPLLSPDGKIVRLDFESPTTATVEVVIENISPDFRGFQLDPSCVSFNIKSTLAQLGINGIGGKCLFDKKGLKALISVRLQAYGAIGALVLSILPVGAYIGKLFAQDKKRLVDNPATLREKLGAPSSWPRPFFALRNDIEARIEKVGARAIAYLPLQKGTLIYESSIYELIPFLVDSLLSPEFSLRSMLPLHQTRKIRSLARVKEGEMLLVNAIALPLRGLVGKVAEDLLPAGYSHTTASILEPTEKLSGDIYELWGDTKEVLKEIPLEFYHAE